jgi:hypothetical protein
MATMEETEGAFLGWQRVGGKGKPWRAVCRGRTYREVENYFLADPARVDGSDWQILAASDRPFSHYQEPTE